VSVPDYNLLYLVSVYEVRKKAKKPLEIQGPVPEDSMPVLMDLILIRSQLHRPIRVIGYLSVRCRAELP
jgi:hypothetical protein